MTTLSFEPRSAEALSWQYNPGNGRKNSLIIDASTAGFVTV